MKIGLVLSGGGARGIAHLGSIQALEEAGVEFHAVSGVSAGALVGALYCAGYTPTEIRDFIKTTNFLYTFRPSFNTRSLLNLSKASNELKKYFTADTFESLKKPLYVTTADLKKGKVKVFKKGQLITPILASCSIPVVFDPMIIGRRTLVDGGVLDNLPTGPLKKSCEKIIGLHCNPIDSGYEIQNWRDLMERAYMMTATTLVHTQIKKCDIFIEPPGLSRFGVFDFKKADELFELAYGHTSKQIQQGLLDKLK